jgi:hypothetical protein
MRKRERERERDEGRIRRGSGSRGDAGNRRRRAILFRPSALPPFRQRREIASLSKAFGAAAGAVEGGTGKDAESETGLKGLTTGRSKRRVGNSRQPAANSRNEIDISPSFLLACLLVRYLEVRSFSPRVPAGRKRYIMDADQCERVMRAVTRRRGVPVTRGNALR